MSILPTSHFFLIMLIGVVLVLSCSEEQNDVITEQIITMERAALDRWGKGDVYGYLDIYADEITYFDTATEQRIDGLAAMKQRYVPIQGKINIDHYDMIDPKVQVHGQTAVLTYNLIDYEPNEQGDLKEIRWNSTAVYAHVDGEWKIIHSHWAHTRPHDQDSDTDLAM